MEARPSGTVGAEPTTAPARNELPGGRAADPFPQSTASVVEHVAADEAAHDAPLVRRVAPLLVAAYFAGALVCLLRVMGALWGGHRLRSMATVVDDAALLAIVAEQSRRVGLKLVPVVAYCERVAVPTVVGVVRPLILLPVSLLTGLAPDQTAAIISHELAHIRRYDLLMNLLQRVIESVLFFHPVVWLISRRMSAEREACCDDLVVSSGHERMRYADALLRMAELCSLARRPDLTALAASGRTTTEFERRIRRLIGANQQPRLCLTRAGLCTIVTLVGLLLAAPVAHHYLLRAEDETGAGAPRSADAGNAALAAAVGGIWKDAAVGSDPAYRKRLGGDPTNQAIAPADMRHVIVNWTGDDTRLRNWPGELRFQCENERLVFSWEGEITNLHQPSEARRRMNDALKDRGFERVDAGDSITALGTRLGMSADQIDHLAKNQAVWHVSTAGETEIAVNSMVVGYEGGGYQSGVHFRWFVGRPFPHPQPTLGQLLAVLPDRFRVPYLAPAFYKALADEPVVAGAGGRHIRFTFRNDLSRILAASIESLGFEYERELEPHADGSIQKMWLRYRDLTYAHITATPGSTQTRFSCQAPQYKGEPKTGPRPRVHPVLQLPRSKRPVLDFDQLVFSTPELKRRTRTMHELAERTAGANWFVRRYADQRYSSAPIYGGVWQTTEFSGGSYPQRLLPFQSLEIALRGPAADRYLGRGEDATETLDGAGIGGTWIPREGWAAWVHCQLNDRGAAVFGSCTAIASRVDPGYSHFSFSDYERGDRITLTGDRVSVEVREGQTVRYQYQARLPLQNTGAAPDAEAAYRRFLKLYESPEALRDAVLADLETLRKISREEIPQMKGVGATDWSNVRSDNPPRPLPPSANAATAETQRKLLEAVTALLDAKAKAIRENYEQIFNSLRKALPVRELL